MADQLQLRRGTTSQILLFTGAQGEVVVNTDTHALVVQDGITAGGFPSATGPQVTQGTFYYNENVGSAANAYLLDAKPNTNTPSSYVDGVQFGFVTTHPNTGPSTANFSGLGVKSLKFAGGIDPQAGEVTGRVYLIYDAGNGWMEIQRKATAAPPQLRTVSASVGSNTLIVGMQPDTIDFRSGTLNSGTVNRRTVGTALSLVVPAGATLGTQSAIQNRIAILAIDNAGTVQLGVCNMAGGTNLDETTLLNTTAITAASNSQNVVYSSSAISGVPFRVVGFVESTQAVAGTWSTTPSEVQGQGGQTIIGAAKITLAASQATTSGTAFDYTAIPAGTKQITIMFHQLSLSGTSFAQVQLGTSGGVVSTGYTGAGALSGPSSMTTVLYTTGFGIGSGAAANVLNGQIILSHLGNNIWTASGSLGLNNTASVCFVGGSISLPGVLDRVRLNTGNGTDTFDLGTVNILFEG